MAHGDQGGVSTQPGLRPSGAGGPGTAPPFVVVGAGPAGLTAALELVRRRQPVVVCEAEDTVGGISRTVERDGWRFDIGGHRFFTKVPEVEARWHELLPDGDLLVRPRLSRIYYRGKFFAYPIRPLNALGNLGVVEAARCVGSYLAARVRPPAAGETLEDYIVANYGRRLYQHFFKAYTEKVWGVPASELSADWGAQRIKGMSLFQAVWEPIRSQLVGRRDRGRTVTSLVEEFSYPRLGPGMLWERCADAVVEQGGDVRLSTAVTAIRRGPTGAESVVVSGSGGPTELAVRAVISSMPLSALVAAMDPPAPAEVRAAARRLRYRDFLTVALVVPAEHAFPDNWIYVHAPEVRVGRIQNYGAWSPEMVRPGGTCLGLEYFVAEGDELWSATDDELVALARSELAAIGLAPPDGTGPGYVVRQPKAYPVYDEDYEDAVGTIRKWLDAEVRNVHPVGRNGMHRYNNQDHSMVTAMRTVENLVDGSHHDVWAVNVEQEYHEADTRASGREGTGRGAPLVPARRRPERTW